MKNTSKKNITKNNRNKKGGNNDNLVYRGYCDNHPSQCMQSGSTSCSAGGKRKLKKQTLRNKKLNKKNQTKRGGHKAVLSNYNNKIYFCPNGQPLYTPGQGMPNCLINNDWSQGLGQNPGVTDQMLADMAGPGQGGKRNRKTKLNKRRNTKRKNNKKKGSGLFDIFPTCSSCQKKIQQYKEMKQKYGKEQAHKMFNINELQKCFEKCEH